MGFFFATLYYVIIVAKHLEYNSVTETLMILLASSYSDKILVVVNLKE